MSICLFYQELLKDSSCLLQFLDVCYQLLQSDASSVYDVFS